MKFKIGDRVRVRKDLKVGEQYGEYGFNYYMEKIIGQIVTIIKEESNCYIIKESDFTWRWTDEMLEPVEGILDEAEKEYLRNVIKYVIEPTHRKLKKICKYKWYIAFILDGEEEFYLPTFKDKRMYKGMELDKEYTLEELGL